MPTWTKEQLIAINEEGKNIIVSAGAGSGKTAVLSERVLRKLKEGVNINELLILTFTKAAAKEMKERIRKKIKNDKSLFKQLNLIDASYITTFDSFALSTVKKYHYLINVSPNISVIDPSLIRLEKEKILDQIFDEKYRKEDKLFEKLIGDFCIKDDKEIKKYILSINDKLDLKFDKKIYLENYLKTSFDECKVREDILKFEDILKSRIDEISDILEELSFITDGEYYYTLKDTLNSLIESKNYDEILYNLNISVPKLPGSSSDEVKMLKTKITGILKELKSLCKYKNIDEIYNQIMNTYDYVKCIIEIILKLDEKIYEYKFKNDMFEFNDIAILAIKILREYEYALDELKNQFNEIMIDEYQDTNDIQEEFISLISNNNVYMVGDIKQSIYRFRNANPYIFKNKYDNYKDNKGGFKIDLNKNFRSRKEVLNNINTIFEVIMDNALGGAEYKESHEMIFGNTYYDEKGNAGQNNDLEIYNYNYDKNGIYTKEEIEAFIIANDIKKKIESKYKVFDKDELIIKEANYSDFVILMDKSINFSLYKKIFEYLGVPLTIYKDEKITEDIVLSMLKNTLLLIQKVHDEEYDIKFKYLFISILRSPLFETGDDVIFKYFKNNNFKENELYELCLELSKYIDNMSIKDFINLVIDKFNFYESIIKIGNVNSNIIKLDYILNVTDNFSSLGYTIKDFSEYLEEIIEKKYDIKFNENKETGNSVKIMTIHKSKGLEYHICYYPGLYSKFNISDLNDKFMFDNKYGIISPVFDEGIDSTIYKDLVKNNYIKEEISEKIRLFYVGLTRAKEKMILVCNIDKDETYNKKENGVLKDIFRIKYRSFKDMVLSVKEYLYDYIININVDEINITKDYNLIKKNNYLDFIDETDEKLLVNEINIDTENIEEKSFSKKTNKLLDKSTKENINLGLDMHYIFEIVDFKNPNLDKLDISDFYKYKVIKFLKNDLFKNINNAKIYKEYEFMYKKDNISYHGIIDLMLVYDDRVDIIDYKLKNIDDEKYISQLNGYRNYIKNKTGKEVVIYLYSIMDDELKAL
ncbi:MAG: UvrD-helicase domain-containing protein [Bacilli bacterium]|nr:UvrD-helicase domain-containing protein [Bacilli bacterium]